VTSPVGSAAYYGQMRMAADDQLVHGTADIYYRFENADLDVYLHPEGDWSDLWWEGANVENGHFRRLGSRHGSMRGAFYGPSGEGVAGSFERGDVTGVFGALRQDN